MSLQPESSWKWDHLTKEQREKIDKLIDDFVKGPLKKWSEQPIIQGMVNTKINWSDIL